MGTWHEESSCANVLRGSNSPFMDTQLEIGYFDLRSSISGEYLFGGLPRLFLKGKI